MRTRAFNALTKGGIETRQNRSQTPQVITEKFRKQLREEDWEHSFCHSAMYRSAAKRLMPMFHRQVKIPPHNHIQSLSIFNSQSRFSTSSTSESFPNQNPDGHFDSSSSSTSTKAFNDEKKTSGHDHEAQNTRTARPGRAQYEEEQERVLRASLNHVVCIFIFSVVLRPLVWLPSVCELSLRYYFWLSTAFFWHPVNHSMLQRKC